LRPSRAFGSFKSGLELFLKLLLCGLSRRLFGGRAQTVELLME